MVVFDFSQNSTIYFGSILSILHFFTLFMLLNAATMLLECCSFHTRSVWVIYNNTSAPAQTKTDFFSMWGIDFD